jgi:hypothetical protein
VKRDGATFWYIIIRYSTMYNTTHVGFSPSLSVQWNKQFIVCATGGTGAKEGRKKFQYKLKKEN